jgi:multiple sugar transport system permease protein
MLEKLQDNRNALGYVFMLPAAVLLIGLLAYPLGLGTWLGFTDAKIGRPGEWVGLENFSYLVTDSVAQLALFNTLFYTTIASVLKFFLGLWLALLLNKNIRFKSFFRAVILLPYIVPTALSAIAFWWIFDAQFSIISWDRPDRPVHRLSRHAVERAAFGDRGQCVARRAVRRHHAAGRPADDLAVVL